MIKISHYTTQFRKDIKICVKRGKNKILIESIMKDFENGLIPTKKHRDHTLSGGFRGYRECHIERDWLLIYKLTENTVIFVRTGTHSDLFK